MFDGDLNLGPEITSELLQTYGKNGWEVVNASNAFNDPVFSEKPDILPAGESIIWALAKQSGKYESILRYPGEDGDYEEANFNEFMKNYDGKHKSLGIKLTTDRINFPDYNGLVTIEDLYNEDREPIGTKVSIQFQVII